MHVGSPGIATTVYPYAGYCATSLTEVKEVTGYGGLT